MGTQKREVGWRASPGTLAEDLERTPGSTVEGLGGSCNIIEWNGVDWMG